MIIIRLSEQKWKSKWILMDHDLQQLVCKENEDILKVVFFLLYKFGIKLNELLNHTIIIYQTF